MPFMKIYIPYCRDHKSANELIENKKENKKIAQFLKVSHTTPLRIGSDDSSAPRCSGVSEHFQILFGYQCSSYYAGAKSFALPASP